MTRQDTGSNAIDLLIEQHEEIAALFNEVEAAASRERRQARFVALAGRLFVHTTAEERHFYPAARSVDTEDFLLESIEDHLAMKRVVADVLDLDPADDDSFVAKIKVLREEVEHHVRAEEEILFPRARALFSPEDLLEIARAMRATAAELDEVAVDAAPFAEAPPP